MPLDPALQKILELIESMNLPSFKEMGIAEVRKLMEENPILQTQEEIFKSSDFKIEREDHEIACRIYEPENSNESLIIYYHGGGFVFGSLDSNEGFCRRLANSSGCRVLSVDYRLAPENPFPAGVNDAFDAFNWAYEHASDLGIQSSRIAVCGDSAGGNLAAVTCLMLRDRKMSMPRLQVLLYPALAADLSSHSMNEFGDGYFLTREQMEWFHDCYTSKKEDNLNPYLWPIIHENHSDLPEAIIVTAEYDPLRDQGESYVSVLRSAGVEALGIRVNGMMHGFASFSSVAPAAKTALTMIGQIIGNKLIE